MLPPVQKWSGLNQERNLHRLFRSQNSSKQIRVCGFWCERHQEMNFSLEEALLWIMGSYFSWKQWFEVKNVLMDLFLTNTQLLSSQDVNWWTGVMWITGWLLKVKVKCGQVWWPILRICALLLTRSHTHTHTLWTHTRSSGLFLSAVFISCLDSHSDGTHSLHRIFGWTVLLKLGNHQLSDH